VVNIPTIYRREVAAYFLSPIAWVVLALFLIIQGYQFFVFVQFLSQPNAPHGAVLQFFFGGTFLYWMVFIEIVSLITMRLLAEEQRNGTLETLCTAPVTDVDVVLGKYLAALTFYAFLWVPTVAYVVLLANHAGPGAGPELGPVAAGYLGTLLVGAPCLAIGLLASALSRDQIIAGVATFVVLMLLLLLGVLETFAVVGWKRDLIAHVNLFRHMEDFGKGVVDTRRVVFLLSLAVFALFASVKLLGAHRWRS
jgi:ABC-2 type transport system permease protein